MTRSRPLQAALLASRVGKASFLYLLLQSAQIVLQLKLLQVWQQSLVKSACLVGNHVRANIVLGVLPQTNTDRPLILGVVLDASIQIITTAVTKMLIGMDWPEVFTGELGLLWGIVHGLRVINARVTNLSCHCMGVIIQNGILYIQKILPHIASILHVTVALKMQFYGLDRLGKILTRHILLELPQNALTQMAATPHCVVCAKRVFFIDPQLVLKLARLVQ
jgi:hypothetical protein